MCVCRSLDSLIKLKKNRGNRQVRGEQRKRERERGCVEQRQTPKIKCHVWLTEKAKQKKPKK